MTKPQFLKRIQPLLTKEYELEELDEIFTLIFSEIKEVVREGNSLKISKFGEIYSKRMSARNVKGGWYSDENKTYHVPAKRKIGLSSYPSVDKYVSTPLPRKKKDSDSFMGVDL
jgi:nucleoid DNA-binding protein